MAGFIWWLVVPATTMCVDNVNVATMDFSLLPATTQMVEWREGRGELELTTSQGLRTVFYDVTPYVPFFQQYMSKLSGLTLPQAQKIQCDLCDILYDSKRQLPYVFHVASGGAGTKNWSALDSDIAAMSLEAIPFITGNVLAGTGGMTAQINGMIDSINSGIVAPSNTNATYLNNVRSAVDGAIIPQMNAYLQRGSVVVSVGTAGSGTVTPVATPGLPAGLGGSGAGGSNTLSNINHISGPAGGTANIPWSPIDATAALMLTMDEFTTLMTGISTRRQTLLNTKNSHKADINALSTIAAVISYSVLAGW